MWVSLVINKYIIGFLIAVIVCLFSFAIANAQTTYYWVGNGGDWSDSTNHWATSSGGAPDVANVPDLTTDVVFDVNSFTVVGQIVYFDVDGSFKDITISGVLNNPLFTENAGMPNMYGSFFSDSNITFNAHLQIQGNGTRTFVSVADTIFSDDIDTQSSFIGTMTFSGTISLITFGPVFNSGIINLGSSIINISGAGAGFSINGAIINFNTSNVTITEGTLGIQSTSSSSSTVDLGNSIIVAKSFSGARQDVNQLISINFNTSHITTTSLGGADIYFLGGVIVDFGTATINGNELVFDGYATILNPTINFNTAIFNINAVYFSKGRTTNTTTFPIYGSLAGGIKIIGSIDGENWLFNTPGDTFNLSIPSGIISTDYLNITNSHAGGGAIWYAGSHSIDNGGNTGWIFTDPPPAEDTTITFTLALTVISIFYFIATIARKLVK